VKELRVRLAVCGGIREMQRTVFVDGREVGKSFEKHLLKRINKTCYQADQLPLQARITVHCAGDRTRTQFQHSPAAKEPSE
jgi:hypothetical protein